MVKNKWSDKAKNRGHAQTFKKSKEDNQERSALSISQTTRPGSAHFEAQHRAACAIPEEYDT